MAITRIGPNQSINLASNITGTLPTGNGVQVQLALRPVRFCKLLLLMIAQQEIQTQLHL